MTLDASRPLTYLITKGECEASNFASTSRQVLDITAAAVDAGIDLIQIREKKLTGKLLFELTRSVVEITRDSSTKLLVNDRVDVALAAEADGVHLTSTSFRATDVRYTVGSEILIGVSCHSAEEVAAAEGSDFVVFGPVFSSPGKGAGIGLAALRRICESTALPVIGIGGIEESNYKCVLDVGAAGFAAIRALNDVTLMRRIMRELTSRCPIENQSV